MDWLSNDREFFDLALTDPVQTRTFDDADIWPQLTSGPLEKHMADASTALPDIDLDMGDHGGAKLDEYVHYDTYCPYRRHMASGMPVFRLYEARLR
jgi:hypothetical protein